MGKIWNYIKEQEKKEIEKEEARKEWERTHTCKKCKKIFSEGYPYKKTVFGRAKNWVCKNCAKELELI